MFTTKDVLLAISYEFDIFIFSAGIGVEILDINHFNMVCEHLILHCFGSPKRLSNDNHRNYIKTAKNRFIGA